MFRKKVGKINRNLHVSRLIFAFDRDLWSVIGDLFRVVYNSAEIEEIG
jgi:hypothetical protein